MSRLVRIDFTERLFCTKNGKLACIHDDAFLALLEGQRFKIKRASHVEPDDEGQWWADLSPVGGPLLGPYPSHCRNDALRDEQEWLRQNLSNVNL